MLFSKILSICTQEACIKVVAKASVLFLKEILLRMISLCQYQRKHVQIASETAKAAIYMYVHM